MVVFQGTSLNYRVGKNLTKSAGDHLIFLGKCNVENVIKLLENIFDTEDKFFQNNTRGMFLTILTDVF